MIYLNAGNLWDDEYLDTVIRWNKEFRFVIRVECLFGSIAGLTPTARAADRLPNRDWDFIERYVKKALSNGIEIRYTLNHSCIDSLQEFKRGWDSTLKSIVHCLHDIGVNEWVIASPLLMELMRKEFPNSFLEVSTIAEVSTIEDVDRWKSLGANGINISTSINRDFVAMKRIAAADLEMSILANEACLFRCPWRRDCYNLSSHNSLRGGKFFDHYPFRQCKQPFNRFVNKDLFGSRVEARML